MAKVTGLHHVALRCADFDKSVAFYQDVLGFKKTIVWNEAPDRSALMDAGDGNYIELFERPKSAPAGATRGFDTGQDVFLHLALRTDDCAAMLEKVRASGVNVAMEPKATEVFRTAGDGPERVPMTIAFFNGPDGELIELFENKVT